MGIINGCEAKKWFLRINYNCKTYKYNKESLGNFYFISANISDDIKNLFLGKIGNTNLEYAGAVLQVYELDGITQSYILNVYFIGKANYNGYLVGFLSSELLNVTLDWKKYIKSKKYIDIDVPTEDVNIYDEITQGFKNENIYSNTRVTQENNNSIGMTEFLDEKYRIRNLTQIYENKAYLDEPSYYEYFYLSRTPSICILANSIYELSKSCESSVSKENNNKNNITHR